MQTNSNPSTTQIFSLGVSSFDPPINPYWDVQKIARNPPPPHDCLPKALAQAQALQAQVAQAQMLAQAQVPINWDGSSWKGWKLVQKCWRLGECSFGSQDSPKLWCFLFRNLGWFCFFSWRMLMEKNPEILWNCESVGLTILNVSTSVLLGGVFFGLFNGAEFFFKSYLSNILWSKTNLNMNLREWHGGLQIFSVMAY